MVEIEQKFRKIFEKSVDYRNEEEKVSIITSGFMFDIIKNTQQISIITGINGIGKTHWLKHFDDILKIEKNKSILIELKKINTLSQIENELKKAEKVKIILFDGLDEINLEIKDEVIEYIFSISGKSIVISSRKDFLIKNSMLNVKYNIYEILPISKSVANEILRKNGINTVQLRGMENLMSTPRFIEYILEIKNEVNELTNLDKYKILNVFIKKHLKIMNKRTSTYIEENIHKKILQSLALLMMMSGKNNITLEEFITFLSRINYVDVKSYILNEKIIETFLNNQILVNDGNNIQFETKELLEFLAAKEIVECNISNDNLYNMFINSQTEIDSRWFNVISYLIDGSQVYRKLILNYIFDNIQERDEVLDLLISIDLKNEDRVVVLKNINKLITRYSHLYQHIDYNNNLFQSIVSLFGRDIIAELVKELKKYNFLEEPKIEQKIFINNILTIISDITRLFEIHDEELEQFLIEKEFLLENDKFNVRFFEIYLNVMNSESIDQLIEKRNISIRLFDELFFHCKCLEKLKNIDTIVNKYILEEREKMFSNDSIYVLDEERIVDFIDKNYTARRSIRLLENIDSFEKMNSFLKFFKKWNFKIFNKKTIAQKLYNQIIEPLIQESFEHENHNLEDIMFENENKNSFEKILEICVKQQIIKKEILILIDKPNYILEYVYEMIIKIFLNNGISFDEIFNALPQNSKIFLYNTWKFNFNSENEYVENIIEKFPEEYKKYQKSISKLKNENQRKMKNSLEKINKSSNIYYLINEMEQLIKNDEYKKILSDRSTKKTFQEIIKRIEKYIESVNVETLEIIYNVENKNYELSKDFYFYSFAVEVLINSGKSINKYSEKNIVLLNYISRKYNVKYYKKDYEYLINYLTFNASEGYIKYYFHEILERLRYKYKNNLVNFIINWINNYEFEEYQINILLDILKDDLENINVDDLKKFKKYKTCQDLMIMLNIESEISSRVDYIKEFLVFEGDFWDIEKNGNYEYSSKKYIEALSKIDIKHINYISDLVEFAFKKYNEGDYYYFVRYILELVSDFVKNNKDEQGIHTLLSILIEKERKAKNRFFYKTCKSICEYTQPENKEFEKVIAYLNYYMLSNINKIYSSEELFSIVKKMVENDILADIKKMDFIEIFRIEDKSINFLKESVYQFFIGYELSRMLMLEGFKTKVVYETTSPNKKRGDIQLITEGFVNDIIIETKLSNNPDLSLTKIEEYLNNTLDKYRQNFNSPKILFVVINQEQTTKTAKEKIERIKTYDEGFVYPVLIDLKDLFDEKNGKVKKK